MQFFAEVVGLNVQRDEAVIVELEVEEITWKQLCDSEGDDQVRW